MPSKNQNNRGRRSNVNNPEGHNQYNNGWMDSARERPFAAAATAAAAVGAGVFLWSKRGQISEQLSNLSDQIGEWTENMNSREFETVGGDRSFTGSTGSGASGNFDSVPSAGTGRATTSTSRSTGNKRRSATSGGTTGSGTMTGGSLDTGPSGRDSA